jgi:hypothetical protein
MTAARPLAAIIAADVVGYSRLMGEDEAGTCGQDGRGEGRLEHSPNLPAVFDGLRKAGLPED